LSPLVYRYHFSLDGITWERGGLALQAPEIRVQCLDYRWVRRSSDPMCRRAVVKLR
jgi:hypothetical protein